MAAEGEAVDTVETLRLVQAALRTAANTGDTLLHDAAMSVMSALIVGLRHQYLMLPVALGPHLEKVRKCRSRG